MHITPRLSVEGPDSEGYYAIRLSGCGDYGEERETDYLTRAEADALIAALNPWRPIETLPIETRAILWCVPVKNPSGAMSVTGTRPREEQQSIWMAAGGYWPIENFTLWQPLPADPIAPERKE